MNATNQTHDRCTDEGGGCDVTVSPHATIEPIHVDRLPDLWLFKQHMTPGGHRDSPDDYREAAVTANDQA